MYIAVIGGRNRKDKDFIFSKLKDFVRPLDIIVSGAASGADTIGEEYADSYKIEKRIFPPDKETYLGLNPYLARNRNIAELADIILAFPDIGSSGTYYTIQYAQKLGKRVVIFPEV